MDFEYGDRPSAKEAKRVNDQKGYLAARGRYTERCASEGREPLPERYGINQIPSLLKTLEERR